MLLEVYPPAAHLCFGKFGPSRVTVVRAQCPSLVRRHGRLGAERRSFSSGWSTLKLVDEKGDDLVALVLPPGRDGYRGNPSRWSELLLVALSCLILRVSAMYEGFDQPTEARLTAEALC